MFLIQRLIWSLGRVGRRWAVAVAAAVVVATTVVAQIQPRVVGGAEAVRGRYPWMVALATRSVANNYEAHFCGGVLIHPHWVLTAAHCVESERPTTVDVVIGVHNLQTDVAPAVRRVAVREIVLHPGYNPEDSDSDLALLLLATPVTDVMPLEIIDSAALCEPGTEAVVLGWGATSGDGSNFPAALQEVGVPLVSLVVANAEPAFAGTLTGNMLAAGPAEGGRDSCRGDSGGPLIVPGPVGGLPMVAGVVSFGADGLDCAAEGGYGIYTRVIEFREWIYQLMRPEYARWERVTGNVGERRDANGDGVGNWAAFLGGGDPVGAGGGFAGALEMVVDGAGVSWPQFSFRRRTAPEVRTRVYHRDDGLAPWTLLEVEGLLAGPPVPVPGLPGVETVVIQGPGGAGRSGFYRVTGDTAPVYVAGPRPIAVGQTLAHTLHTLDPLIGATRAKTYELLAPPSAGEQVSITARSSSFDVGLHLLEAGTLTVLQSASTNSAGGTDETLTFLPESGKTYLARVAPASGNSTTGGKFSLHYGMRPGAQEYVVGAPTTGSLATTDALNPAHRTEVFYMDEYRVVGGSAGQLLAVTLTSEAFGPVVSVHDGATGDELWPGPPEPGRSRVSFYVAPGANYVLRVSSAVANGLGTYTLAATSVAPMTLVPPQSLDGRSIDTGDLWDPTYSSTGEPYYMEEYVHTALGTGPVTVRMTSSPESPFDTFLTVYDALTGELVEENDDISEDDFNSELAFTANAGRSYIIRCSTALLDAIGTYSVSVQ